jgi:hypothetical protein
MKSSAMATVRFWPLSAAEIHFLYWCIQGSIMYPETRWRLRWRLRERGPCLMCEMRMGPASASHYASVELVARGRRLEPLRAFAGRTRPLWELYVRGVTQVLAWDGGRLRHPRRPCPIEREALQPTAAGKFAKTGGHGRTIATLCSSRLV